MMSKALQCRSLYRLFPLIAVVGLRLPCSALTPDREKHRAFADELVKNLYLKETTAVATSAAGFSSAASGSTSSSDSASGAVVRNDCTSTWGISMLFDLLLQGASPATADEICSVVGLCMDASNSSTSSRLLWNETVERMTSKFDGGCRYGCFEGEPLVLVSNSIWIDAVDTLNEDYAQVVGHHLHQIDFDAADAGATINQWVSDSTKGLITEIAPEGPLDADLWAINSIYFNMAWSDQFAKAVTTEDTFYLSSNSISGNSIQSHFMHMVKELRYSHDALEGYQVVQLGYVGRDMSMILVLPRTTNSTDTLGPVTSAQVLEIVPNLVEQRVALAMPKFTYESMYDASQLIDALVSMDLVTPFMSMSFEDGFCSILSDRCLLLDQVLQKTVVQVDEDGTIAAAVSAGIGATSLDPPPEGSPVVMLLNRPFQFFIYENSAELDVVLFEGQVMRPEIPSGSQATANFEVVDQTLPQFWMTNFADVDEVIVLEDFPVLQSVSTGGGSTGGGFIPDNPVDETVDNESGGATSGGQSTDSGTGNGQDAVDPNSGTGGGQDVVDPVWGPDLVKHRRFADAFVQRLYLDKGSTRNDCSSSWGISMLFDLLLHGSSAATSAEICAVFGLCTDEGTVTTARSSSLRLPRLLWNQTVERITSIYDSGCKSLGSCFDRYPLILVSNSIWIDEADQLNTTYSDIVGHHLHQIDFDSTKAGDRINQWVNDSTKGLINEIVSPGPILEDLWAINSIYFNMGWKEWFREDFTTEDSFYLSQGGDSIKSHFMHSLQTMSYSHDALEGYQVVKLRYNARSVCMILVLPRTTNSTQTMGPVTSTQVVEILPKLDSRRVALSMPKFKFESLYDADQLIPTLVSMGIWSAFTVETPENGFCFMLSDRCLHLQEVLQKTFIEVNEKGTVAAAVSAGVAVTSMLRPDTTLPVVMLLNRPFQFFIYEEQEDLVLFEGRVASPDIPAGSKAATTVTETLRVIDQTVPEFWTENFRNVQNVTFLEDYPMFVADGEVGVDLETDEGGAGVVVTDGEPSENDGDANEEIDRGEVDGGENVDGEEVDDEEADPESKAKDETSASIRGHVLTSMQFVYLVALVVHFIGN